MKILKLCLTSAWLMGCLASAEATTDRNTANVQQLVDELSALIESGAASRSADRRFLDELRGFIADYDRPWTKTLIDDSFSDGNFTHNPAWTVAEGSFHIDRQYGLVATPTSSQQTNGNDTKELAVALIGQLLRQNRNPTSTTGQPNTAAFLQTPLASANAFAIRIVISGIGENTQAEVALLQGSSGNSGYAMVFDNGQGVTLERLSSRGRSVIGHYDGRLSIGAAGQLTLDWTRGRNGRMRVTQNGVPALQTVDRGLRNGFSRLRVGARGAKAGFKRIAVNTVP